MEYNNTIAQAKANREKARALLAITNEAQDLLQAAHDKLGSARTWGVVDILGGGFLTNMIKHSKIEDAMYYVNRARPILQDLGRALKQVRLDTTRAEMGVGSFAVFADFFFDGVFADVYVQSKIRNLQVEIERTLGQLDDVETALRKLDEYESKRILGSST